MGYSKPHRSFPNETTVRGHDERISRVRSVYRHEAQDWVLGRGGDVTAHTNVTATFAIPEDIKFHLILSAVVVYAFDVPKTVVFFFGSINFFDESFVCPPAEFIKVLGEEELFFVGIHFTSAELVFIRISLIPVDRTNAAYHAS